MNKNQKNKFYKKIKTQYWLLYDELDLAIDDDSKLVLLLDTVWGRAKKGHGILDGKKDENITREKICEIIGFESEMVKKFRLEMIENFSKGLEKNLFSNKTELTDKQGKPYLGINFLPKFNYGKEKEFYQGIVLAGFMDTEFYRKETVKKYPETLEGKTLKIGRGKERLINTNLLKENSIPLNSLSNVIHNKETIEKWEKEGIIAPQQDIGKPGIENIFLRYEKGLGVCDDMALIAIGELGYGDAGMVGGMINDGVDTYTKFIPTKIDGGMDEYIAKKVMKMWENKYHEKLVTKNQIMEIIYLGAKNNLNFSSHSSSHRRFMQYEDRARNPTFLEHLNFVKTGKYNNFKMGYKEIPSKKFYENVKKRFELYGQSTNK